MHVSVRRIGEGIVTKASSVVTVLAIKEDAVLLGIEPAAPAAATEPARVESPSSRAGGPTGEG